MEENTKTFSVKMPTWAWQLLNIIAESREHGTNGNDLLKKCLQFVIETAKITGPVPPEFKALIDMLRLDASWHNAFNFGDVTATNDIAQMILILQQHEGQGTTGKPREGYGMVMINKPFMGNATMTFCVDDILERVVEVSMKGLYRQLRQMGIVLGAESMRETLTTMCDAQLMAELDKEFQNELPQVGNFSDFGKAIEYGKKTKAKHHRTPDGEAMRQQRIRFTDEDLEAARKEAEDD